MDPAESEPPEEPSFDVAPSNVQDLPAGYRPDSGDATNTLVRQSDVEAEEQNRDEPEYPLETIVADIVTEEREPAVDIDEDASDHGVIPTENVEYHRDVSVNLEETVDDGTPIPSDHEDQPEELMQNISMEKEAPGTKVVEDVGVIGQGDALARVLDGFLKGTLASRQVADLALNVVSLKNRALTVDIICTPPMPNHPQGIPPRFLSLYPVKSDNYVAVALSSVCWMEVYDCIE